MRTYPPSLFLAFVLSLMITTPALAARDCYCAYYSGGRCVDLRCDDDEDDYCYDSYYSSNRYFDDCYDDYNDDDNDDDITLSITDSSDTVRSGDVLTYTIRIRNNENDDIRIDIRAVLDKDTTFISASDGGDEEDDEVEWDNFRIDEDESETITLRVRVRSSVRSGDVLRLVVNAEDEEDTETTRVRNSSSRYHNDRSGDICQYYNSYMRQNYLDYCDSRHEDSRN